MPRRERKGEGEKVVMMMMMMMMRRGLRMWNVRDTLNEIFLCLSLFGAGAKKVDKRNTCGVAGWRGGEKSQQHQGSEWKWKSQVGRVGVEVGSSKSCEDTREADLLDRGLP